MLKPKLVIVDDHRVLNDAIKALVEPEFEVVAIFSDGREFLNQVADIRPDAVVLDIGMPRIDGFAVGARVRELVPKVKIIYLTMHQEKDFAAEAFQLGASGYVLKSAAGKELISALREVLRGGYYASPSLTEGMIGSFVRSFKKMKPRHSLTPRQREVLQLLSEGLSMKEVANQLDITPRTVAFHKYTMMQQLELGTTAELLSFAASYLPSSKH